MKIKSSRLSFVREPLAAPFGFKGAYLTELWQVIVDISTEDYSGLGLGVQSVLWSDAGIFSAYGQEEGNHLMLDTSRYALELLRGRELAYPPEMLSEIFPQVYAYAVERTGKANLRPTFVLNSLVAVDHALWQLWARKNGSENLPALLTWEHSCPLQHREEKLSCIPLASYNTPPRQILSLADEGAFLIKIKIGSDPEGDGDREKMLNWDMARLSQIHDLLKARTTEHSNSGHILYYLDANGRYDSPERLLRLIDHADFIGALERIVLLEEPFPEGNDFELRSIPLRLAADESIHSAADTFRLIEQGYSAIALKPIAKTLSVSLDILSAAHHKNIPCFCADLTVNPALVELNKNIAGRIDPLPGLKIGVLESNGAQNYKNWDKMCTYHPLFGTGYDFLPKGGIFRLSEDFYRHCGGIFTDAPEYKKHLRE